jgi:hypothetical protein
MSVKGLRSFKKASKEVDFRGFYLEDVNSAMLFLHRPKGVDSRLVSVHPERRSRRKTWIFI